jgi:hypothetical protein
MNDDLPPLPPVAEALFRSERKRPGIPEPARQRVAQRLTWAFGEAPPEVVGVAARPRRRSARSAIARAFEAVAASVTLLGPVPLATAGVGVGGVLGLGIHTLMTRRQEPAHHAVARSAPANAPATAARSFVIAPLPELPSLPATSLANRPENESPVAAQEKNTGFRPPAVFQPAPEAPPSVAATVELPEPTTPELLRQHRDLRLAAEETLLERARRALRNGEIAEALDRLTEHRMTYPDSQLTEERELLSVEAEIATGNVGAARFHAEEFQRRFPHSLLLPRLQAALQLAPGPGRKEEDTRSSGFDR